VLTSLTSLLEHVDPKVAIGVLAVSALITVSRTIVSIVKIRTSRTPMVRMATIIAKRGKKDPALATQLFLLLQAGDRADALSHDQLSELLNDAALNTLDKEPPDSGSIEPADKDSSEFPVLGSEIPRTDLGLSQSRRGLRPQGIGPAPPAGTGTGTSLQISQARASSLVVTAQPV
jgi:hypothetical protein